MENLGYDEEYDCTKYRYIIRETSNVEGSANLWYDEDIVYCLTKDIMKTVMQRGNTPSSLANSESLRETIMVFDRLEIRKDISDSIFGLPYETSNR